VVLRAVLPLLVALVLAVVSLVGLGSNDAAAHAAFERSDPMPNAILAESPEEIRIWFTEPLEFDFSEARLYDQDGQLVAGVASGPGEGEFSLLLRVDAPLARGTYSVVWENLSTADGHTAEGYFAFTVGSVADVTAVTAPVEEDSGPPLWLRAASRWVVLLAIAPLIAAWLMWLAVLYPSARGNAGLVETLRRRVWQVLAIAFAVAVAGNVLALVVQGATLSGGSLASRVRDTLIDTRYGELWLLRIVALIGLALALLVADWREPFTRRWRTVLALGISLLVGLPISLNAHASALTGGRTTAIVFDWVHITGASIWFGGLVVVLAAVLRPARADTEVRGYWGPGMAGTGVRGYQGPGRTDTEEFGGYPVLGLAETEVGGYPGLGLAETGAGGSLGSGQAGALRLPSEQALAGGTGVGGSALSRRALLVRMLPRFSAVAIVCWGLLALTGAYAAWLQVGSWDALTDTDYGKSLLAKLMLLAVVLGLAAVNLLFVTRKIAQPGTGTGWGRRLSWTVASEIALTVVVLFFVGRMTSLQPARDVVAAGTTGIEASLDLEGHPATLQIAPGQVGPNHFVLEVGGEALPDDTEAVIRVELDEGTLGMQELQLDRSLGNRFEWHGSEMSVAGDWSADAIVRRIGDFTWEGSTGVTIEASAPASRDQPWRLTSHSIAALLLVGIGLAGLVIAWRAGPTKLRTESASLGALAIVLGFGIMATDRVTPASADLAMTNPIPATADSIVQGREIYESLCLSCHGANGQGDGPGAAGLVSAPADFTAGHAMVHADGEWFAWIQNGKPGTAMPAFGDQLSDEEIWHVINSIQTEFQSREVVDGSAASPAAGATPAEDGMEGMDHGQ
jgi:copper transport protein